MPSERDRLKLRVDIGLASLGNATDIYTDALRMATSFNDFIQQAIAVTGGTVSEKVPMEYRDMALSPADSCAVEGRCNINRHPALKPINIPNYKVVYGTSPEKLVDAVKNKNVFEVGGTIANPLARLINTNVDPSKLNTMSVEDMIDNRNYPLTFALEPIRDQKLLSMPTDELAKFLDVQKDAYGKSAETYRVKPARPNWIIDLEPDKRKVQKPFEAILIPSKKDERGYVELSDEQIEKYLSKQFVPSASGGDWVVDYSIFGMLENPFGGEVLVNQGAHWLGGFGGNTLVTFAERIPEENIEIYGISETLSDLYRMLRGEGVKRFQSIINTVRMPVSTRAASVNILLEPTKEKVLLEEGASRGYELVMSTLVMLGIID